MAQTIVLNGQSYTIPDVSEDDWGLNLTNYFIAIPQAVLQKSGGAFALTADANFGASFGLVGIYYKSRTANVSTSGVIRLAVTDTIGWRNNANGGNLLLSVDASDRLVFNGTSIISNAITALTGDVTATGPGSAAATIAANAVTNAKMATMVTATAKANISGSTAVPSDVSLVAAATASTIMLRDSNANVRVNSHIDNYATTVTAAGTTVLTVASARTQFFTGSTTQTVTLPDATTLVLGQQFFIVNRSSGVVTVNGNTGTLVKAMVNNSFMTTTVTDISSAAGTWTIQYNTNGASVSSVDMTVPTFLSVSGNPITTAGTLAVTLSGTALPVANGGTAVTSVTTSPTASSFAGWDGNANLSADSFIPGYATTATAAGTTTLTVTSVQQQYFTGTTTQTVTLPVASTLVVGQRYLIVNLSTGVVTVQSSGANSIQAMASNTQLLVTCILASGTGTASWNATYQGTSSGALPLANGGTGQVTKAAAFDALSPMTTSGDVTYGGTSGTGTRLAKGSDGTSFTMVNGLPAWLNTISSTTLNNVGISTAVASNALTITLTTADGSSNPSSTSPAIVGFSISKGSGAAPAQKCYVTGAVTTTISSGSTAGHASGIARYLYVYLIYINATSAELAWSSALYDEGSLQTSTSEGGAGAADSNSTLYSTTGRSLCPIRLIGRLLSTQATAGTWVTAMSETTLVPFNPAKVVARYATGSTAAVPNVTTVFDFATKVIDTHNAVTTGASWAFTAPKTAFYLVNAIAPLLSTATVSRYDMQIRKNAVVYSTTYLTGDVAAANIFTPSITAVVQLNAGDTVDVSCAETVNNASFTAIQEINIVEL